MEPLAATLIAVATLILGLVVGYFVVARQIAPLKAECESLRVRCGEAEKAHAVASSAADTADKLRITLDGVRDERDAAMQEIAGLRAGAKEREEAYRQQLEQMKQSFAQLATQALNEAQAGFLKRADQRFEQAGNESENKLKLLLQPVEATLRAHRETIEKVEAARTEAYGNLAGIIGEMKAGQEAVRSEAAKLANSLRSAPKARGRWGEQQLRNVLETCGLTEHCDFEAEVSVESEEGRLRPDVTIRIPGGKTLVIDAKVSLNAYQDAFGAVDEQERAAGLAAHAAAMKAHVNGLGNKAYWAQFADAPDYVIMFVPGEHFLAAALEYDAQLWNFAFEKRVLLATPTNLIAIARTVSAVWQQETLATQAKQIGELGTSLHERLAVAAEHLKKVGSGLSTAVNNYNGFVGSFEKNVLSSAREFKALGVKTGKRTEIEVPPSVEALPRYAETAPAILFEEVPEERE